MKSALDLADAPDITQMRVPDFFIVGSPKTGTTWLHATLRKHPQIFMPKIKEPQFLASDARPRARHERASRELGYPKTLEDYLALFEDAMPTQLVGEATPTYLWSRTAAENIAGLQPDARIIAILREPASFLHSLHNAFLRGRNEAEPDLRKAMALEADRREGRHIPRRSHRPQFLQYSEHVRYVEQLRRYHRHFPAERVLVLIYDDFRNDNAASVRKVLQFLEVDDESPIAVKRANVTKQPLRSRRARRMMNSISRGQGPVARSTKMTVKALTTIPVRHAVRDGVRQMTRRERARTEAPPPDDRLMLELRKRFKGEVVALSEYLDRDLVTLWGYQDID
jgi:hypothetical protein